MSTLALLDAAAPSRPGRGRSAGFTLLETVIAAALVGIGLLGTVLMVQLAATELQRGRELAAARLAATRVIEITTSVRIRSSSATITSDNTAWLFRGTYEIARDASGASFAMPDLRTSATTTEDGASGWVVAEFPVPSLTPVAGRTHAGRVMLHVNETTQTTASALPTPAFPFPSSVSGQARLDCDGDGAATTTDIRQRYETSSSPCRLVPAKVVVEWRSDQGRTERADYPYLIVQPGF